eukprot:PITA_13486
MAKGFAQKSVYYEETFDPIAKRATIQTLFALAKQKGWKVQQMDVKTAFLNGGLKENVFMSQPEGCVMDKNKKFGMAECNPLSSPMEQNLQLTLKEVNEFDDATKYRLLVVSLIYLTKTRPNISFFVRILFEFMQNPCEGHWSAAKRVLKYLKGTQDFGLKCSKVDDFNLIGCSDSYFHGDRNGVSTSEYLMSLGSETVVWRSHKQSVPANFMTEAKYVPVIEATKEIVWLKKIIEDLQQNK